MPSRETMQAAVWRDNKFVTILSTRFNVDDIMFVKRWDGQAGKRVWVPGRMAHSIYQKYMAAIDLIDRFLAAACICMHHFGRRFQRSIFFWQVGGVTSNTFIVVGELLPEETMKQLKRLDRGGSSMGLATFLQTELGLALIYRGTAKGYRDLTDDQRDDGEMPPWVPKPVGRPPADGGQAARPPQPTAHVWEAHAFSKGRCLSCLGVAEVVDERRNLAAPKGFVRPTEATRFPRS
jgi:hypothetical protein